MAEARLGGSFAPPLPAAKLAEYRELIGRCTHRQTREELVKLCDMVELFQQTPRSTLKGTPHPVGRGTIVPLEAEEIVRIWDAVPYESECEHLAKLFEPIQAEESARNSVKVQAWVTAVVSELEVTVLGATGNAVKIRRLLDNAADLSLLGLTEEQSAKLESLAADLNEFTASVQKAVGKKELDGIPYPALEDTRLRDLAHHLLWNAVELSKDREPMTTDQL